MDFNEQCPESSPKMAGGGASTSSRQTIRHSQSTIEPNSQARLEGRAGYNLPERSTLQFMPNTHPNPSALKILFIGGTGKISTAVSQQVVAKGHELYLLNRGLQSKNPPGSHRLTADINQPKAAHAALRGLEFDVVVDWVAYTPEHIERDLALFQGRTRQFIFISSASVYQKPPTHHRDYGINPPLQSVLGLCARQNRLRRTPAAGLSRGTFSGDHCSSQLHLQPLFPRRRRRLWLLHAGRPLKKGQTHHRPWRRLVVVGDDSRRGFWARALSDCSETRRPSATHFTSPRTRC